MTTGHELHTQYTIIITTTTQPVNRTTKVLSSSTFRLLYYIYLSIQTKQIFIIQSTSNYDWVDDCLSNV